MRVAIARARASCPIAARPRSRQPPALHSSSGGGGRSPSRSASCQFTSDSVLPAGTVEIQPPGHGAHHITTAVTLPCHSFPTVASGKADATFVTIGRDTMRDLRQNTGSISHAVLWIREPVAARYLFRLAVGLAMLAARSSTRCDG
jgi:hypothetical protein